MRFSLSEMYEKGIKQAIVTSVGEVNTQYEKGKRKRKTDKRQMTLSNP